MCMLRIIRVCSLAALAAMPLLARTAGAQSSPPHGASSATQMVRAAGMPLNDGTLPPGSLTVRVVAGAFTGDLRGISVELAVEGAPVQRALTGEKGRAEFAHLPVGSRVRVSTVVGSEPLQSELFPMPAESGVRILLVAQGSAEGGEAGATPSLPLPAPATSPAAPGAPAPTVPGPVAGHTTGDILIVAFFGLATLVAAVLFLRRRPRRTPAGTTTHHDTAAPPS